MSSERIFNVLILFEDDIATQYGVRFHRKSGTDGEKSAFLKAHVANDTLKAKRFKLPRPFSPEEWRAQLRIGDHLQFFEEAFVEMRAVASPIYCMTSIANGVPVIDQIIPHGPFRGDDVTGLKGAANMPDYLVKYVEGNRFLFTQLMNDDYFEAIKILFNSQKYVSASKLLMCCVDTLSYVYLGDKRDNFIKWLDEFCDLSGVGITAAELWQFRNSIIHMTNLDSRAVMEGKQSRIFPYVGPTGALPLDANIEGKPFHLPTLIDEVANGIGRWGQGLDDSSDLMLKFIERYDRTISDARLAVFRVGQA